MNNDDDMNLYHYEVCGEGDGTHDVILGKTKVGVLLGTILLVYLGELGERG